MAELGLNLQLEVVVVGGSSDEFVQCVMNLLGGCGVEHILCEDVYSAVGKMAVGKMAVGRASNGVVIGRLGQLSREDGRFFHIAHRNGLACCCLADKDLAERRGQVLSAIKAGVFVAIEPKEILEVLMKLLGGGDVGPADEQQPGETRALLDKVMRGLLAGGRAGSSENSRALDFLKDEFLMTRAELDALLGA